MFFLFSLGAEMIGAGSLLSHARAKRDKPQIAQGQRGDAWVLNPSVGPEFFRGGRPPGGPAGRREASCYLAGSSPNLLESPAASPKARAFSRSRWKSAAPQTPWPRASGNQQRSRSLCPQTHPAIELDDRQSLLSASHPDPSSRQYQL